MINKNEIRIGNLISDIHASDSFYAEVKQITKARVYYGAFYSHPNDLKPIPLTEEWLLKFGFSKYKRKDYIGLYNLVKDDLYFTLFAVDDDGFGNEGVTKLLISNSYGDELHIKDELIEYVHQLQNLYFALTSKDLTIKEANND